MKKLIFTIVFFTACITAKAQVNKDTVGLNLPVTNGQVIYTGVVEVDGKTKEDLYKNAQQWFMDFFSSQKDVIQDKDKEEGIVFGEVNLYFFSGTGLGATQNWTNHFTIKIECKDNKYRYSFYNMLISTNPSDNTNYYIEQLLGQVLGTQKWPWTKNAAKNALISNGGQIRTAILSLKAAMGKTTTDF
jgi:hypothetical protein